MNPAPSDMIRSYLIGVGAGSPIEVKNMGTWPIYTNARPDGVGVPDNVISIFDTNGRKQGRIMSSGRTIIHPGIQIVVRASESDDSFSHSYYIAELLDQIQMTTVTVNSVVVVLNAFTRGPILTMGKEPGNRQRTLFSQNGTLAFQIQGQDP